MVNRKHKDKLFRYIFNNKSNLLQLYNAFNNSTYDDIDDLEINTLEDVIWMGVKNDLSFVIDDSLNVYEHQSSFNPNVAIRGFFYMADLYRKMLTDKNLYSSKLIKIPTPSYIVFYNGEKYMDDKKILKLSDAFKNETDHRCLECKAVMLNINYGHNKELMKRCSLLSGYSQYVSMVKRYTKFMIKETAVLKAIDDCIKDGNPLSHFFMKQREVVFNMTLTEYDEAKVMQQLKEDYLEEGREEERTESRRREKELINRMIQNADIKTVSEITGISINVIEEMCKE